MIVEHRGQKTATALDVVFALKQLDINLYGFGIINKGENIPNRKVAYRKKVQKNAARMVAVELAEAGEEDEEPVISEDRLKVFARTLGRLATTPLFEDDSATLNDVLPAINQRLMAEYGNHMRRFDREESIAGLKEMADDNKIMYLDDSEEIYKL